MLHILSRHPEIPPALFLAGSFRSSNQVPHREMAAARGEVTPAVRNTWAAGAIVVGAIKIYIRHLPTRDRHALNLRNLSRHYALNGWCPRIY